MVGRGVVRLPAAERMHSSAPVSGVHLGAGRSGPIALRMFRRAGTRIAVVGAPGAAQLLAVRAASGGTPVLVMTSRERVWSPALAHGPQCRITAPARGAAQSSATPAVIVDDRPEERRGLGEVGPWQCRIDVRTPLEPAELASLSPADAVLLGRTTAELAAALAVAFGVAPAHPAHLTSLVDGRIAVVRRGALDYVTLDPTPAEASVLRLS
jgi:hypothetical protein